MEYFVQQLLNGLTLGAIYGLIAIGYSMVYGIIGMINFAHGEIYLIGAFLSIITFTLLGILGITWVPLALVIVLLVAMAFTSAYGWTVERLAYRPLRGSFRLAPLISAIGILVAASLVPGAEVRGFAGAVIVAGAVECAGQPGRFGVFVHGIQRIEGGFQIGDESGGQATGGEKHDATVLTIARVIEPASDALLQSIELAVAAE